MKKLQRIKIFQKSTLKDSESCWDNVWKSDSEKSSYSFLDSRKERALDKIGYFIQSEIAFHENEKVLEAGCGDGLIILNLMTMFKIDGYGVDISQKAQEKSKTLMAKNRLHFQFQLSDISDLNYPDNYFDKIICLGVVEHLRDSSVPVLELARVLKPKGKLILMTPNKFSLGFFDRLFKQLIGIWNFGLQAEFTVGQLEKFTIQAGLTTIKKEVTMRKSLPNDNLTFRTIAKFDQFLNLFSSNWGFYSYIFSTKKDVIENE